MSDYIRGLNCWLNLFTTLTHNTWLRLIIAPLQISTLYKSLEHTASTSRFLVTASSIRDS
jgi:hypothetical protein